MRVRRTIDLDDDALAGWEAMGRRTGGGLSAIGNVLGRAMASAVADGLRDPTWATLAEAITTENYERSRRRGRRQPSPPPAPRRRRTTDDG